MRRTFFDRPPSTAASSKPAVVSLDTVAAAIGHEINNPLSYVLTSLEFVLHQLSQLEDADAASARVRDLLPLLQGAHQGAERIRSVVQSLASRVGIATKLVPCHLVRVVEASLAAIDHELRHRARVVVESTAEVAALSDATRLGVALVHLLANAAQAFTTDDPATNLIRVRITAGVTASIEITDNGPGIAPDVLERMFDPFFTTKPDGTGLGLAIARSEVSALRGSLSCESAVGQGTTFRISLPLAPPIPPRRSGWVRAATTAPLRPRVLLIDDEPLILASLTRMLRDFDVVWFSDPLEAVRFLVESRDADFDLVLCDMHMPGLSGPEVYNQVRARHPRLVDRFVFASANLQHGSAPAFLASVSNERLEKPFTFELLRDLVLKYAARGR